MNILKDARFILLLKYRNFQKKIYVHDARVFNRFIFAKKIVHGFN